MDIRELERIIYEEVQKALSEQQRSDSTLLPPIQKESVNPQACFSPSCTIGQDASSASSNPTSKSNAAPNTNPNTNPVPEDDGSPAILTILSGAKEHWEPLAEAFQKWRKEGIRLDAIYSSSAREVFSSDELNALGFRNIDRPAEIRQIMWDMSRYTAVFLPSISRTHAAKLALGITDNITLNLTLSALAQEVPTFATNEGLAPTACVVCGNHVPGIQEVLDNYRNQLSKMGLRLLSTGDAIDAIHNHVFNKANSGPDLIKTLITQEDAVNLKGPVVKVTRGGLVTPLAMEIFRNRGIEVIIVPQEK